MRIIDLPNGSTKFKITSIKLYYLSLDGKTSDKEILVPEHSENACNNYTVTGNKIFSEKSIHNTLAPLLLQHGRGRLRKQLTDINFVLNIYLRMKNNSETLNQL